MFVHPKIYSFTIQNVCILFLDAFKVDLCFVYLQEAIQLYLSGLI